MVARDSSRAPVLNRATPAPLRPESPGRDTTSWPQPAPVFPPVRSLARTSAPEGSRNGRILAAIPAREVVGEPGRTVHFVADRTLHRTHVGRRHRTRPVAGHTAPGDRLPPGRFPQHSGAPPFGVPTARTSQLCHAGASSWMAWYARQGPGQGIGDSARLNRAPPGRNGAIGTDSRPHGRSLGRKFRPGNGTPDTGSRQNRDKRSLASA